MSQHDRNNILYTRRNFLNLCLLFFFWLNFEAEFRLIKPVTHEAFKITETQEPASAGGIGLFLGTR